MADDTVKKIKDLTATLSGKVKPLAKQAEAGFKSNWMGLNKEGKAEWADIMPDIRPSKTVDKYLNRDKTVVPGIVYNTAAIPSMLDLISEGMAPRWAVKADEKAGKIKEAVEKDTGVEKPKGLIEHLARASGEMVAQIPTSGRTIAQKAALKGPGLVEKAITQGPELIETARQEAPGLIKKVLTAPVEYFSPVVDVTTPTRAATSYGAGTAFGGGLGYGIDKLLENDKKSEVQKLIDKYGTASGTENYDVSKSETRQKFEKGGLGTKLKEGKSAFFSAIDNAIATLKQGKGTPEQLMSQVKKTPGVKKEELELRNLDKALAGKTSITKEELAEVAKKNAPPVPKVIRKKRNVSVDDQVNHVYDQGVEEHDLNYVFQWIEPDITDRDGIQYIKGFKFTRDEDNALGFGGKQVTPERVRQLVNKIIDEGYMGREDKPTFLSAFDKINDVVDSRKLSTKYDREGLRLEGGEDYQENLVQLPTRFEQFEKWQKEKGITDGDEAAEQWRMETGLPVPSMYEGYTGGHWGSEVPDVVGHYRTQTFTDKDGKKVLYVEEIQSDPHQNARDKRKSYIDTEIRIEKDKLIQQLKQRSPDQIPPGWKIEVSDAGDSTVDVKLIDDKGKVHSTNKAFSDVPGHAGGSIDEAKMLLRNNAAVKKGFEESADQLVDKKAIASQFPDNYGYKTIEDEKKLVGLNDTIERIREEGLDDSELATYFTPGKVVPGYGGYDKVLEFYPTTADKAWSVKVINVNSDGTPMRNAEPRIHSTDPSSQVVRDLRNEASTLEDNIPDMPWKKTYDELMLKQIIDDAVQGGYDSVAISPGITQVERYSNQTRQVIDSLDWTSTDKGLEVTGVKNGNLRFSATVRDGKIVNSISKQFIGESLDNVLGKDMADKIKATPSGGTIEGDDITVGGEGMKSFYDKRVPDFLRDYVRKEFGIETGTTEFGHGEFRGAKRYTDLVNELARGDSDLNVEHEDQLMEYYMDYMDIEGPKIARANDIDPDSPSYEEMLHEGKGPFSRLAERAHDYAINKVAGKLHDAQKPEWSDTQKAFSFNITPEVAEKVKTKGQRLFAAAPVVGLPLMEDDEEKRKVSPSYTIAPQAKTPTLTLDEENAFQNDMTSSDWFNTFKQKYGEPPNLDAKDYDYRAAWKSGVKPMSYEYDDMPHWPSTTDSGESLKARNHPSAWMEDYMQLTGRDPHEGGDLSPDQIDAMGKALQYRYGYAKGGFAQRLKDLKAKLMFEDQPMNMSRRSMMTLPEATPQQTQASSNFIDQMVNKPMDRREFLQKAGNAAKNTALRGALADLAPLAEMPTSPLAQVSKEIVTETPTVDLGKLQMEIPTYVAGIIRSKKFRNDLRDSFADKEYISPTKFGHLADALGDENTLSVYSKYGLTEQNLADKFGVTPKDITDALHGASLRDTLGNVGQGYDEVADILEDGRRKRYWSDTPVYEVYKEILPKAKEIHNDSKLTKDQKRDAIFSLVDEGRDKYFDMLENAGGRSPVQHRILEEVHGKYYPEEIYDEGMDYILDVLQDPKEIKRLK